MRNKRNAKRANKKKQNILLILIDMFKDFCVFSCEMLKSMVKLIATATE